MRQIFVSTILLSHFSAIGAFSVFGNICQSPRCVSSQPVCIFRQNIPIVRRIGKDHTIKCSNSAGDLSEEDQERGKKLADAWIRQDKALECSRLLQVGWRLAAISTVFVNIFVTGEKLVFGRSNVSKSQIDCHSSFKTPWKLQVASFRSEELLRHLTKRYEGSWT